ncbi:hypothetical protein HHI36_024180, partial [Cryptolaemus montrouzieri]
VYWFNEYRSEKLRAIMHVVERMKRFLNSSNLHLWKYSFKKSWQDEIPFQRGSAVTFLQQYERISTANAQDDALKMAYLESFLEGPAVHWLQRFKADSDNLQKTWTDLEEAFTKKYR